MTVVALLSFAVLLFASAACAQANPAELPLTDLSTYTQAQLIACEDKPALCGAKDVYQVDSELIERLPRLSTTTLVRCFADWHVCGVGGSVGDWEIAQLIHDRGATVRVIRQFGGSPGWQTRAGIEYVAYQSKTHVANAYMRRVFVSRLDDGEHLYWPAMYLAKRCDAEALRYLNPGPNSQSISDNFSVSSLQFSHTASLFGKCRYRPAIPIWSRSVYMQPLSIWSMLRMKAFAVSIQALPFSLIRWNLNRNTSATVPTGTAST